MEIVRDRHPGVPISIVAHSFGTYAISQILEAHPDVQFHRLVLCGSIIPNVYRWDLVKSRFETRIINDYGTRDVWPILAKTLSWGYGDTGSNGFGVPDVLDREHNYSHSDYFNESFVREYWQPWFANGDIVPSKWAEQAPPKPLWLNLFGLIPMQWIIVALLVLGLVWGVIKLIPTPPDPIEGKNARQLKEIALNNKSTRTGAELTLVWCPAGTFKMGSPLNEVGHKPDEGGKDGGPVEVKLTKGFWMAQTETTQEQWTAVMGTSPWIKGTEGYHSPLSPSVKKSPENPQYAATFISHGVNRAGKLDRDSATAFCKKLTEIERENGQLPLDWEYALPTEAQWEYACRAETKTAYNFGDDVSELSKNALCDVQEEDEKYAHVVKPEYDPNKWRLYDMHGNVTEWCRDGYAAQLSGGSDPLNTNSITEFVVRGGSWQGNASSARCAARDHSKPEANGPYTGFRVVLTRQ